jgi:hypothetical protein
MHTWATFERKWPNASGKPGLARQCSASRKTGIDRRAAPAKLACIRALGAVKVENGFELERLAKPFGYRLHERRGGA